ncbi:XRE family transcriptional regulator [Actinomadura scrupuli]|uniref:XRE family transcriptional regulator n=1 Tax=Actinomadura scrupuli TaxID=559629 RepID=UPI003D963389
MNEPLRRALTNAQLSEHDVAARLAVDAKTVRRWLAGRTPYARHRSSLAALIGMQESELWPALPATPQTSASPPLEVLATYPHRWAVPHGTWQGLFESAEREIGILVYAGLFISEDIGILRTLESKAQANVAVRILLGDPDSPQITTRGEDEGIGTAISAKIRNALTFYQKLRTIEGIEIRLHQTPLYASIYRADDELLVNPHVYGIPAAQSPVLHVRMVEDGDIASMYLGSFERVWANTAPCSRL